LCLGLVLLYAYRGLRLAPAAAGVVLAAGGLGGYGGIRYGGRILARHGAGPALVAGGALGGLPWLLAPALPAGAAPVLLAVVVAVSGFFGPVAGAAARAVRQALIPRDVRTRAAVTARTLARATLPVAAL